MSSAPGEEKLPDEYNRNILDVVESSFPQPVARVAVSKRAIPWAGFGFNGRKFLCERFMTRAFAASRELSRAAGSLWEPRRRLRVENYYRNTEGS